VQGDEEVLELASELLTKLGEILSADFTPQEAPSRMTRNHHLHHHLYLI
jgi:hypothetical protein